MLLLTPCIRKYKGSLTEDSLTKMESSFIDSCCIITAFCLFLQGPELQPKLFVITLSVCCTDGLLYLHTSVFCLVGDKPVQ